MCLGLTPKSCSPATEALERALKVSASAIPLVNNKRPMISIKSLKRSRSSLGSFDLSILTEATKPVEDSIAFPSIEWSNNDFESEDEEVTSPPPSKRRCHGLVRYVKIQTDLSLLAGVESYGSLC